MGSGSSKTKYKVNYFNQKKFLIIFDDFDRTIVTKNVGLFARFLADYDVHVDIVTNKSERNAKLKFPKGIHLIRLATKRSFWPQLDDPAFEKFIKQAIGDYFALWVYRGRPYTRQVLALANLNNIITLVKLDSNAGFSLLSKLLFAIFPRNLVLFAMKFGAAHLKIPHLGPFSWFLLYDTPLSLASIILCETPKLLVKMGEIFGKSKCFLFTNSLPVAEFTKLAREFAQEGLVKKKQIISVGRIVRTKAYEKVVSAFLKLPRKLSDGWQLKIIGPFYDEVYKKKLIRLIKKNNAQKSIILSGGLYGRDLYKEYFQSKIMMMAYPKPEGTRGLEGQPNVVVEAMFFKNAVLTVDSGSVDYLLDYGKCGMISPSDDVGRLTRMLEDLVADGWKMRKLAKSARRRVEEKFNLDKLFPAILRKIRQNDYSSYLNDQESDDIVGESLKGTIYKYCDFLTKKLAERQDFGKLRILDVGCREFFTYDYFLEFFKNRILGIDIGREGLEYAKSKNVINLDMHKMGGFFGKRRFDLIFALHVFEHAYDLDLCLRNCRKVLANGGLIYFALPIPSQNTRRGHWVSVKNESEMVKILNRNGFSVIFHKLFKNGQFRQEPEMVGLAKKN